jgi:hypothetical protein
MTERSDQLKTIPLTPVDSPGGIPRREALQALLGGVGAGFALTSVVEAQHPVHEHLASPASVEHAQQKAAVAAYTSEFLVALGAFDMAATAKHGKGWNSLSASEQDALLRDASAADPKSAMSSMSGHFQNLKGWVVGAYYSSEPGMRELGWTGNMFFAELPGCTHPGGHQA